MSSKIILFIAAVMIVGVVLFYRYAPINRTLKIVVSFIVLVILNLWLIKVFVNLEKSVF